jgi:hypothetical protein
VLAGKIVSGKKPGQNKIKIKMQGGLNGFRN